MKIDNGWEMIKIYFFVIFVLVATNGCTDNQTASTPSPSIKFTLSGSSSATHIFNSIYCTEMSTPTNPSTKDLYVRFTKSGEAFPSLQISLTKMADIATGPYAANNSMVNMTLIKSPGGKTYVTKNDFVLTLSDYEHLKTIEGKIEYPSGSMEDSDDSSITVTASPSIFSFKCPCVDNGDTLDSLECPPQRMDDN